MFSPLFRRRSIQPHKSNCKNCKNCPTMAMLCDLTIVRPTPASACSTLPRKVCLDVCVPGASMRIGRGMRMQRGDDVEVVVDHKCVSRLHARVENRDGLIYLVDEGSSNGSCVNGVRVTECELTDGDMVRFGGLRHVKAGDRLMECDIDDLQGVVYVYARQPVRLSSASGYLAHGLPVPVSVQRALLLQLRDPSVNLFFKGLVEHRMGAFDLPASDVIDAMVACPLACDCDYFFLLDSWSPSDVVHLLRGRTDPVRRTKYIRLLMQTHSMSAYDWTVPHIEHHVLSYVQEAAIHYKHAPCASLASDLLSIIASLPKLVAGVSADDVLSMAQHAPLAAIKVLRAYLFKSLHQNSARIITLLTEQLHTCSADVYMLATRVAWADQPDCKLASWRVFNRAMCTAGTRLSTAHIDCLFHLVGLVGESTLPSCLNSWISGAIDEFSGGSYARETIKSMMKLASHYGDPREYDLGNLCALIPANQECVYGMLSRVDPAGLAPHLSLIFESVREVVQSGGTAEEYHITLLADLSRHYPKEMAVISTADPLCRLPSVLHMNCLRRMPWHLVTLALHYTDGDGVTVEEAIRPLKRLLTMEVQNTVEIGAFTTCIGAGVAVDSLVPPGWVSAAATAVAGVPWGITTMHGLIFDMATSGSIAYAHAYLLHDIDHSDLAKYRDAVDNLLEARPLLQEPLDCTRRWNRRRGWFLAMASQALHDNPARVKRLKLLKRLKSAAPAPHRALDMISGMHHVVRLVAGYL